MLLFLLITFLGRFRGFDLYLSDRLRTAFTKGNSQRINNKLTDLSPRSSCLTDTHTVMVKHVVKRDGRVVIFDNRKIVDAILKAMNVTEEGEDIVLAAEIASAISKINVDNMSVEDIQDQVEYELMNSPRKEVAKKYIAYRNQRNLAR